MSTLKVTVVQAELHWHEAVANRDMFGKMLGALEEPTDLVVLPEMFTTGFTMHAEQWAEPADGETFAWLTDQAATLDAAVCGSLIVRDDGRYFNRFVFACPDGTTHVYDKRHLFRLAGEHKHYSPGRRRLVFEWRGFRICPQVCYDLRFPVWSRNRDDYDLLVYVANWPAARHLAWQTLIRARAIENQAYVTAVNRTGSDGNNLPYEGGSGIIDYLGRDLVDLGSAVSVSTAELSREELTTFRERFPFHMDADRFSIAADC